MKKIFSLWFSFFAVMLTIIITGCTTEQIYSPRVIINTPLHNYKTTNSPDIEVSGKVLNALESSLIHVVVHVLDENKNIQCTKIATGLKEWSADMSMTIGTNWIISRVYTMNRLWFDSDTNLAQYRLSFDFPRMSFLYPSNQFVFTNSRLLVKGKGDLSNDILNSVHLLLNDEVIPTAGTTNWHSNIVLQLGSNTLKAVGVSEYNNTNASTQLIIIYEHLPEVLSFSPSYQSSNISTNASVYILFSKSMNTNSVLNTISINPPTQCNYSWSANCSNLSISSQSGWMTNTTYQITISNTASDLFGLSIRNSAHLIFTTRAYSNISTN